MNADTLSLAVGSTLQLQPDGACESPRFSVKVIGLLPGGSLIVQIPCVNGNLQIVREGQKFTVRMLSGERLLAFVATVLYTSMKPYPHMHLEYPEKHQQIVVRDAVRVEVTETCLVRNIRQDDIPENYLCADIMDMSKSGAKIACEDQAGEINDTLQLNFCLKILNKFEEFSIFAKLKNSSEKRVWRQAKRTREYITGVQFAGISRYHQVCIQAWVMQRLADNQTIQNPK